MGEPIASRLLAAGRPLLVWSRTPEKTLALAQRGADVADSVEDLLQGADTVLLMLANGSATDDVLMRGTSRFEQLVAGHLFINLGTASPDYSVRLAFDIAQAGGTFVEAPVSGSRVPAERGELVGMLAGDPGPVATARGILEPACRAQYFCGNVPGALRMKIAINSYLLTTVAGLVEAFRLAEKVGVDLSTFVDILGSGPMASGVSEGKLRKLLAGDFAAQAAVADVSTNARLVSELASDYGVDMPLLEVARLLYERAASRTPDLDMVAIKYAFGQGRA